MIPLLNTERQAARKKTMIWYVLRNSPGLLRLHQKRYKLTPNPGTSGKGRISGHRVTLRFW